MLFRSGNQTSTIPLTEETLSTEGLTLSYEGKYDYDATSKLGTFTLSEPFIYSGNGIEMIIASDATTYGSNSTWYGQLCSENQVFQRYGDLNNGTSAPEIFPNLTSKAFAKTLPTMIIYTESEPGVVTGYVTHKGVGVEDAKIAFESKGRKYLTKTDADGSYTAIIKQTDTYNVTINHTIAAGESTEEGVALTPGANEKDFILDTMTGIEVIDAISMKAYVANLGLCRISATADIKAVKVVAISGNTVSSTSHNETSVAVDMNNRSSGVYIVIVDTEAGQASYKVIKR